MKNQDAETALEFFTPAEVQRILKCSRGYVYKMIERKGFPKPIYFSPRCRRWDADKVDAWCREQKDGKQGSCKGE